MKNFLYLFLIVFGLGMYSCAGEPNLVIPDIDEAPGNTDDTDNDDGDGDGTVDDGKDVEFTEDELKLTRKRGLYLTSDQFNVIKELEGVTLNANLGWVYNMCDENSHSYGVECVNFASVDIDEAGIANLSQLVADGNCKRIMAFDVPYDLTDDAAIQTSVDAAITKWASLQALKVPMGSPCVDLTKTEHKWFEAFMNKIEELGYRVDYLCVKYYGAANLDAFTTAIENLKNTYDYPIIVTGLAVINDNSTEESQTVCTEEQVFEFMKQTVNWMEVQPYINGYVWTSFNTDDTQGGCSSLLNADGQLNSLGNYYIKDEYDKYGQNLVPDDGFEESENTNFWKVDSPGAYWYYEDQEGNNEVISGNGTCRMQLSGCKIISKNPITIIKGKTYRFGFTGRIQKGAGPENSTPVGNGPYVQLKLYDKDGKPLNPTIVTDKITLNKNTIVISEAVLNVEQVKIGIYIGGGQNCYAYVDDVILQEVK